MNIVHSFANYLDSSGVATLGADLIIRRAPRRKDIADSLWWVRGSGGQPVIRAATGESVKEYQVEVFYRDIKGRSVYDKLYELEEQLNCSGCIELEGYDVLGVSALTFPTDEDLDGEDREVGMLQATIRTYKSCNEVS